MLFVMILVHLSTNFDDKFFSYVTFLWKIIDFKSKTLQKIAFLRRFPLSDTDENLTFPISIHMVL